MNSSVQPMSADPFIRLDDVLRNLRTDPATAQDPIKRTFVFDGLHVSANVAVLEPGGNALHIQPFHDELVVIVDGECDFRVGERTARVRAGDLICIPRGTLHGPVIEHGTVSTLSVFAPSFDRGRKNILWARDGFA